jgi:hypothetical protein
VSACPMSLIATASETPPASRSVALPCRNVWKLIAPYPCAAANRRQLVENDARARALAGAVSMRGRALPRPRHRRPCSAQPVRPATSRHLGQCEYISETDPVVPKILLKVRPGLGEGYDWVECGACGAGWQVPYFESVG